MGQRKITVDDKLDNEIDNIKLAWRKFGFNNVSKAEIIRLMVQRYKENGEIYPYKPPKSPRWRL